MTETLIIAAAVVIAACIVGACVRRQTLVVVDEAIMYELRLIRGALFALTDAPKQQRSRTAPTAPAATFLSGTPSRIQRMEAIGNAINDAMHGATGYTTFTPTRTTADRGGPPAAAEPEPEMTLSVPPPQLRDYQPPAEYAPPADYTPPPDYVPPPDEERPE